MLYPCRCEVFQVQGKGERGPMNTPDDLVIRKALKEIARREGITVKELRHSIEQMLEEGRNSGDPEVLSAWAEIPGGVKASVEDVIRHVVLRAAIE